jgi:hypothetical protein
LQIDRRPSVGMLPAAGRRRVRHDTAGENGLQIRGARFTPISASRIASAG